VERRLPELISCDWKTFFPRFELTDILEREWWLMANLHMGYNDIKEMPWEFVDWFYNRHIQDLVDKKKARDEQNNHFG